jgi:hypothetical protein
MVSEAVVRVIATPLRVPANHALSSLFRAADTVTMTGFLLAMVSQTLQCNREFRHYSWMMGSAACPGFACAQLTVIGLSLMQVTTHLTTTYVGLLVASAARVAPISLCDREAIERTSRVLIGLAYATQAGFCCVVLFPAELQSCPDTDTDPEARKFLLWHISAVGIWLLLNALTNARMVGMLDWLVAMHHQSASHADLGNMHRRLQLLVYGAGAGWTWTALIVSMVDESRGDVVPYTGPIEVVGLCLQVVYSLAITKIAARLSERVLWPAQLR